MRVHPPSEIKGRLKLVTAVTSHFSRSTALLICVWFKRSCFNSGYYAHLSPGSCGITRTHIISHSHSPVVTELLSALLPSSTRRGCLRHRNRFIVQHMVFLNDWRSVIVPYVLSFFVIKSSNCGKQKVCCGKACVGFDKSQNNSGETAQTNVFLVVFSTKNLFWHREKTEPGQAPQSHCSYDVYCSWPWFWIKIARGKDLKEKMPPSTGHTGSLNDVNHMQWTLRNALSFRLESIKAKMCLFPY